MNEKNIYIFDMDGTLYQIDGSPKGFSGSSLESSVLANAKTLIIQLESCDADRAEAILQDALKDQIGISRFLSTKYGLSREEYFAQVWNIAPETIVQNFEIAVKVVQALKEKGNMLVLLTSAPQVWEEIVLGFLGILDYFDEVYTGEKFGIKDEIFAEIAKRFETARVTSVGDQLQTDILPAELVGCNTLLVDSPDDLKALLLEEEV